MDAATLPRVAYADLSGKRLAYNFTQLVPGVQETNSIVLVVFVNGLGLPQASWQTVIDMLKLDLQSDSSRFQKPVALFTYDRDGQGLSRAAGGSMPKPHDLTSAAQELDSMIDYVKKTHLSTPSNIEILLAAHSIGVPLARLYCQQHTQTVTALLALDSNMSNTDFVSLMPDPDSSDFNADKSLPADTTIEQLRWTRENYRKMFHPSAPNPESLDRSNLAVLLPRPDSPALIGPDGHPVLLTVVGHDPAAFAIESLKISTKGLTEDYMQPAWSQYNEGLLQIGDTIKGVVIADGSAHFVQRDNPRCVADEIVELLVRMNKLM